MALNLNSVVKLSAVTSGIANIVEFTNKLRSADKAAVGIGSSFKSVGSSIRNELAAIVGVGAMVVFTKTLIDAGDELWTLHERTGVAVEDLSKFQGAAEQSGTSLEAVAKGITKINKSLGENDGNAKMLRQLGIDTTNATTAMLGLADVMSKTQDPALRSALAIQLFGKSGAELVPLLSQGRKSIEDMSNTMSADFAKAADEFNDTINDLKRQVAGDIMKDGTGALVKFTETLNDPEIREGISGIVNGLIQLIDFATRGATAFYGLGVAVKDALSSDQNKTYKGLLAKRGALEEDIFALKGGVLSKSSMIAGGNSGRVNPFNGAESNIARLTEELAALDALISQRRASDGAQAKFNSNVDWSKFEPPKPKPAAPTGGGEYDAVLRGMLSDDAKKAAAEAEKAREREAKQRERALQQNREAIAQLNAEAQSLGLTTLERERATAAAQLEAAGIGKGTQEYKDRLAAVDALHAAKFDQTLRDTKDALDEEIAALKLETDQIGMSALEIELSNNVRKMDLLLKRLSKDATEEEVKALEKLIETKKQEMAEEIKRKDAMKGDWMAGAKAGLKDYYDSVRNTFADVQGFISNSLQKTEDALVEFFSTGKLNFKAFVSDLLKELLRLWVRAMIMKPILDMLGVKFPALGNAMAGRALGGAVAGGSAYLVGENGPEIFRPAQSGRIIPNGQMGRMGGGGDVNISISVATDGSTSTSGDAGDAMKLGRMITAKVRDVITQEKRVGGLLAGAR